MQHLPHKLIVTLFLLLLGGCAANVEKKATVLMFPMPPEVPRLVYERGLFSSVNIEEFTSEDRFKEFATGVAKSARGLSKPYGVSARNGRVYVTDTVQRSVVLFDIPGKKLTIFGNSGSGALRMPIGIDAAENGYVYVADSSAKRVVIYNEKGEYINAIGGADVLVKPTDVKYNSKNKRIYVVDSGGLSSNEHRIQVFDSETGANVATYGTRGTKPGEFNIPVMLDIDEEGNFYVVDSGNFRVQKFTQDGKYLSSFGSVGRLLGQFARPKGIALDSQMNVYVIDTAFGNFQIFDKDGKLLMFVGERSQLNMPAKYMLPAGIAVDEVGKVYVVDQFFRRVDVYRPYNKEIDNKETADK
jgi:DNA-binding beta-propeller fold protein YncE